MSIVTDLLREQAFEPVSSDIPPGLTVAGYRAARRPTPSRRRRLRLARRRSR
jgi:hypothetical protein